MPMSRAFGWTAAALIGLTSLWVVASAFVLPELWSHRDRARVVGPMLTQNGDGIPGDPLNLVVTGDAPRLLEAVAAAGWVAADRVTFETSVEIVDSVLFDRPDPRAPISPLFYEGRKQDFAFEKAAGRSADSRSHVRFWRDGASDRRYVGAVSFDAGVTLSRDTGWVTHRIAPDVDAARGALVADLVATGQAIAAGSIPGRGAIENGRNGEGDPYFTDGLAAAVTLVDGRSSLAD